MIRSPARSPALSAGEPSKTEMISGLPARVSTMMPMPLTRAVERVVLREHLVGRQEGRVAGVAERIDHAPDGAPGRGSRRPAAAGST